MIRRSLPGINEYLSAYEEARRNGHGMIFTFAVPVVPTNLLNNLSPEVLAMLAGSVEGSSLTSED